MKLCSRYSPAGVEDKEQHAPRQAQSQGQKPSCLERLLHRVFLFCFVTNAVLNSDGMNDAGLPQGVNSPFQPLVLVRKQAMESEVRA